MKQLSFLLILVVSSYGQQNTTQIGNSSLDSVQVDVTQKAKQADVANVTLKEIITTTPNTEPEKETNQTVTNDEAITEPTSCTHWTEKEGTCVPFYLCNDTELHENDTECKECLELYIDVIIDIETGCSSSVDVCCRPAYIVKDIPTAKPDVLENQVNKSCGHRNPDGVGLNITTVNNDATLSRFGEFPWTVAVLKVESAVEKEQEGKSISVYLGGGSLIHPSVVLTAAHIVNKDSQLRIRAGEWDTQTEKEVYPHQDRDVKEVVLNPNFKSKSLHNDIALLFLSAPVDITPPHIGMACLPNPEVNNAVSDTQCLASGWGKDQFGKEGRYSVILKKVELPLVDHGTCEQRLRETRLGARFELDPSFTCAGGVDDRDTCVGDGGAPLVCQLKDDKDRYVQSGIVAWGIGCGAAGTPGVYVNVAKFRSWIDENIVRFGYDTNTYTI